MYLLIINYIIFIVIVISSKRISVELQGLSSLYLKIYKVAIDSDFIKNESLINALLFECLVVIFLVDESIPNSFEIIKNLTKIINSKNFPDLNLILV